MEDLITLVENYIEKHGLLTGSRLVVGVSGGADSMALLFVLKEIRDKKYPDLPILCAHVHRGIRKEADADEKTVRDFCERLEIPFFSKHLDIPKIAENRGLSLETAGRIERYAYFQSLSEEYGTIAVAHHMEDQAESVAMHIFRGSGMEGLSGIRPKNGNIIHPFLCLRKEDILKFCEEKDIPYCHDISNDDPSYDRNFFRHEVFPKIEEGTKRDPVAALVGLSERTREENDYLDELAGKALRDALSSGEDGEDAISVEEVRKIPEALRRRALRLFAISCFGDVVDLEEVHYKAILSLCEKNEGTAYIDLPGDRRAAREGGKIRFLPGKGSFPEEKGGIIEGIGVVVPEELAGEELALENLPIGEMINFSQSFLQIRLRFVEKEAEVVYNNLTWFFPSSALKGAVIRTRRTGDTISRAGSSIRKELRRFMNEAKIPPRFRDRMLLIAREQETLWLPGLAHAVGFTDALSEERFKGMSSEDREEKLMALEFSDMHETEKEIG